MKPKLLVLTTTFPRWQNDPDPPFVYELAKRLAANFTVTVHAPHYPGSRAREEMGDIEVHRFRYFFEPFEKLAGSTGIMPTLRRHKKYFLLLPFFLTAQFFSLIILVRRLRPDVIHAHWIVPQGFIAVVMNRLFGIPVVVTAHGGDVFGLQHHLFILMKRFVLLGASGVTAVSYALKKKIEDDIMAVPVQVISMGVCSDIFSTKKHVAPFMEKSDTRKRVILYVGRLSEKKGVRYLINAMPSVLEVFPDAELLIVGSGELEPDLKEHVGSMKMEKHIVFTGGVPNSELPAYYSRSDVFVGPSVHSLDGDTEGFGLTFVEASMSGCLLIGSDVGGIREIIEDNKTGFLVPEKDSAMLAEKIIYALKNPDKMKTIAAQGRARCIKKFDWKIIAQQYCRVLMEAGRRRNGH